MNTLNKLEPTGQTLHPEYSEPAPAYRGKLPPDGSSVVELADAGPAYAIDDAGAGRVGLYRLAASVDAGDNVRRVVCAPKATAGLATGPDSLVIVGLDLVGWLAD